MLDVDTFLTTRYVLVDECDKTVLPPEPPPPDPAPALSRSEALTLALFGQWSQFPSERAFYRYAIRHVRPAFPTLPARSQYNRQVRHLTHHVIALGQWVAARLHTALATTSALDGTAIGYEVLDSLGVWRYATANDGDVAGCPDRRCAGIATAWAGMWASTC